MQLRSGSGAREMRIVADLLKIFHTIAELIESTALSEVIVHKDEHQIECKLGKKSKEVEIWYLRAVYSRNDDNYLPHEGNYAILLR